MGPWLGGELQPSVSQEQRLNVTPPGRLIHPVHVSADHTVTYIETHGCPLSLRCRGVQTDDFNKHNATASRVKLTLWT